MHAQRERIDWFQQPEVVGIFEMSDAIARRAWIGGGRTNGEPPCTRESTTLRTGGPKTIKVPLSTASGYLRWPLLWMDS